MTQQDDEVILLRQKFAPVILAALVSVPGPCNDDKAVAHAVSLADKLAVAIIYQPVAS